MLGIGQVRGRVIDVCVSTGFAHYLSSHPTMWGLNLGMWTVVSLVGLQWCHFQHTNLLFRSWIDRPSVVDSGGMSVLGLGRLVDFVVGPRLFVGVGGGELWGPVSWTGAGLVNQGIVGWFPVVRCSGVTSGNSVVLLLGSISGCGGF